MKNLDEHTTTDGGSSMNLDSVPKCLKLFPICC